MHFLLNALKKGTLKYMEKINLLDCTLRDGGYYNNWDFSRNLVQEYLNSLNSLDISFIEMGFRSFQSKDFKGPNWYTTDNYIKSFKIPKKIKIGVMVNAFELISHPRGIKNSIDILFSNKKNSRVDFVRLACHFNEFSKALEIANILKKKGYIVAVNLMQISQRSEQEIHEACKLAKKTKLDILYFADSLGSMDSKNTRWLIPDEYNMQDYLRGNINQRLVTQDIFTKNWLQRNEILFWRGNTTGGKIATFSDLENLPRVKICRLFRDQQLFDFKISKVTEDSSLSTKEVTTWLKQNDLHGQKVTENDFSKYRYYPDIPGNAQAWGTLRKYRMGCLIFKPESDRKLSYYKLIQPWKHYIPVSNDFSDLKEKLAWANQNQRESAQIAYQGYTFSNSFMDNLDKYFHEALQIYEEDSQTQSTQGEIRKNHPQHEDY